GVGPQPWEGPQGRVPPPAARGPPVGGALDTRVAPADMGDDHRVLAFKRAKEFIRRVDGPARGLPFDQDVRRAPDRTAFATEEDVAVAAHAGVARPLAAGKAHETARRIERRGQSIELGPERVGDLKIVALVADHVDEG